MRNEVIHMDEKQKLIYLIENIQDEDTINYLYRFVFDYLKDHFCTDKILRNE